MNAWIRMLLAIAALGLAAGCGVGVYEELGELAEDPSMIEPTIDGFAVEREIHASWPVDEAADTYILYRDITPDATTPRAIYEGTAESYVDTDVVVDQTYYYRLAKRRGQRLFEPSGPVFAVGSNVRQDRFEPNDGRDAAAPFEDGMVANIFAYRDGDGSTLVDRDWYVITVPGNSRAVLEFIEFDNLNPEELIVAFEEEVGEPLSDGETVSIANYNLEARDFFFQMYIDEGEFFGVTGSGSGGGAVVTYRIRQERIESLSS